jgi:hypothetical protein
MYFEKKLAGNVLKFDRNDGMIFQIAAVMPALQTIENWWNDYFATGDPDRNRVPIH